MTDLSYLKISLFSSSEVREALDTSITEVPRLLGRFEQLYVTNFSQSLQSRREKETSHDRAWPSTFIRSATQ